MGDQFFKMKNSFRKFENFKKMLNNLNKWLL